MFPVPRAAALVGLLHLAVGLSTTLRQSAPFISTLMAFLTEMRSMVGFALMFARLIRATPVAPTLVGMSPLTQRAWAMERTRFRLRLPRSPARVRRLRDHSVSQI